MSLARLRITEEHEWYPVHEEDSLPVRPAHERQVRYLRSALAAHFPERWVTGEICMYWEERAFHRYVAPDVLVVEGAPETHPHDVYLAWSDGPALLTIEVGSKSTFKEDEGPKVERYLRDLNVGEYLYYHPHRNERRRWLKLWRLVEDEVVEEAAVPGGRLYSETLGLSFGLEPDGFLRIYTNGDALPTVEEQRTLLESERQRAESERQRAEALEKEVERLRAELARRGGSGQ
jgi:Uma2 family endonuclease